jgi:two-component system sensor histidine kinase/response regulator
VLVVDDNETNRIILQEMIEGWGMQPTLAADGEKALEAMRRAAEAEAHHKYPIALLDAMMPGMDGVALAQAIRADSALADTQLIVLSSAGPDAKLDGLAELAVARRLIKPVKPSDLLQAIGEALELGPPVSESVQASREPIPIAKLRLLLVEDGLVNQRVAVGLLEERGHTVIVANNGLEALERLAEAGEGAFDVVLMDVQMPEMDGFEATAAIREGERNSATHIPIVAMTAHAMKGDRERCLDAGMDDYVSKPLRPAVLYETVERNADNENARIGPSV